jgi:hypothetical protein
MELAKREEKIQSIAVAKLSQDATVQALAVKQFDQVSSRLPSKIKGTFDLPKLHEMILATGEKNVHGFIEFELIKLAERINVSGNLTDGQVEFIASQLVGMYPTETLADFKICFEGIAMGKYIKQDKIFKLDGSEIGYAIGQYMEEKYRLAEDELMKEKDNQYANVKAPGPAHVSFKLVYDYPWIFAMVKDKVARRLAWEARWKAMAIRGRAVLPISPEEIRAEGKTKPKLKTYPYAAASLLEQKDLHIQWINENFDPHTAKPLPSWMPEDEWLKLKQALR